jgi:haloacetate dehalogenase
MKRIMSTRRQLLQQSALVAGATALMQAQPPSATPTTPAPAAGQAQIPVRQPAWPTLFPAGFKNERVKTQGAEINVVVGGSGPPLLLMHGAPQSLCTWHLVAPEISKHYTMIMMDHRGYGDSSKPADLPDHSSQSKRPMAQDGVDVMKHFGYDRFAVVGHDRGGRVGHRMARDHKEKITKLTVIDIVPALHLYTHVDLAFVQAYPHWFSYLAPSPGPENMLLAQYTQQALRGGTGLAAEFNRAMLVPGSVHAMCEDYRASASVDLKLDAEDAKNGVKVQCPLQVLWAATGAMGRIYDVLGIWKNEGVNVTGKGLPGGHSLQETTPKETTEEILRFLAA